MFLVYGGDSLIELSVTCYTDASWETDRDDLQSQTRYVFVMNGGVVDWKSSKQSTTAMSFIKVEYIAPMEAIWIRKLIFGLGIVPSIDRPMDMYCDNTIGITIADEPSVPKVHTDNNLVDPFTKPMSCTNHVDHARNIGLRPADSEIASLKKKVKKLERRNKSRTPGLKRLRKDEHEVEVENVVSTAEVTTKVL
ncbi:hypothetical protein Tco_0084112 [Tanacetum coccineum]